MNFELKKRLRREVSEQVSRKERYARYWATSKRNLEDHYFIKLEKAILQSGSIQSPFRKAAKKKADCEETLKNDSSQENQEKHGEEPIIKFIEAEIGTSCVDVALKEDIESMNYFQNNPLANSSDESEDDGRSTKRRRVWNAIVFSFIWNRLKSANFSHQIATRSLLFTMENFFKIKEAPF